jgi:hypothetical protein
MQASPWDHQPDQSPSAATGSGSPAGCAVGPAVEQVWVPDPWSPTGWALQTRPLWAQPQAPQVAAPGQSETAASLGEAVDAGQQVAAAGSNGGFEVVVRVGQGGLPTSWPNPAQWPVSVFFGSDGPFFASLAVLCAAGRQGVDHRLLGEAAVQAAVAALSRVIPIAGVPQAWADRREVGTQTEPHESATPGMHAESSDAAGPAATEPGQPEWQWDQSGRLWPRNRR